MTHDAAEALRERILESLRAVIDPELGENLVDLGLIYTVEVRAGGAVHIDMSTTVRGCPATGYLTSAVRSATEIVPGVTSVDVNLTYDPIWSPDLIGDSIRHKFSGTVRETRR